MYWMGIVDHFVKKWVVYFPTIPVYYYIWFRGIWVCFFFILGLQNITENPWWKRILKNVNACSSKSSHCAISLSHSLFYVLMWYDGAHFIICEE